MLALLLNVTFKLIWNIFMCSCDILSFSKVEFIVAGLNWTELFPTDRRTNSRMDCRANSGTLALPDTESLAYIMSGSCVLLTFLCPWTDLFCLHDEKFDFDVSLSPARWEKHASWYLFFYFFIYLLVYLPGTIHFDQESDCKWARPIRCPWPDVKGNPYNWRENKINFKKS